MSSAFEWDNHKAVENVRRHNVSFEEATTVFNDEAIAIMPDPLHSDDEERYVAIGFSSRGRLLVVVYTERGMKTRIISCRLPTLGERRTYERGHD